VNDFRRELATRLAGLEAAGLSRSLREPCGIDFSSNDYLGLSRLPRLRELLLDALASGPLSAPASRLLTGNLELHGALEEKLAAYKGTEAALLFSTGYQANLGVLTALIGPQDRALSDALNHASIIDGLRLSRARKVIFPHLDPAALEKALAEPHPGGRTFIVTESLFSMDGDIAPLGRYAELAERYGACLIVDDAHATGLYGEARGSGLAEAFGIEGRATAIVSTFGKALGLFGAFAAGPRPVIDWLVQTARSFIFTTAPPPLLLHAAGAALELARALPERRGRVIELAERLRGRLRGAGLDCLRSEGPIVPVLIGGNERAVEVARELERRGFDVRAIRPPSVPSGGARLRISVHADHTPELVDRLAEAVAETVHREARRR
jgi:8-amino-7-oxononanoate synthase